MGWLKCPLFLFKKQNLLAFDLALRSLVSGLLNQMFGFFFFSLGCFYIKMSPAVTIDIKQATLI